MKNTPQTPVNEIGLAAPAVRALTGAGYHTLNDLAGTSRAELAALHGIGPNALKQIKQALEEAGLRPLQEPDPGSPAG